MAAWKDGTQAQYQGYLKQWRSFCTGRDIDMFTPQVSEVLDFLTTLFDKGLGYSALNTARSSLSSIINIEGRPVGEHQIVVKFMKGVFNLRPSKPRTNYTWDPQIVLDYLKNLSPVKDIDYKLLTYKAVTLLWILSGQRGQSVRLIDIRNVEINKNFVKIRYGDMLKTTRPGFQQNEIKLKAYAPDRRICITTVLSEYIAQRNERCSQDCTQLFITTQKPYRAATASTIARWVKDVMREAGLDITKFTPHSIRAASTSAAMRSGIPIDSILATAGWTKESTFRKYYNKPLAVENSLQDDVPKDV